MKRLRKVVLYGVAGLVLLAVVASVGVVLFARGAWPKASGSLTVAGLHGEVEIRRDSLGVPHVFANDERDVFFGQGFVHAQDRLWQMHLGRALGRGELAKLFGSAALDADRMSRTLGLVPAAKRDLELLDPDARAAVDGYCAGVNAFLASGSSRWPIEFTVLGTQPERWEPLDVMLVGESISLAMSLNAFYEITRVRLAEKLGERSRELIPPYPADGPTTLGSASPGFEPSTALRDLPTLLLAMRGLPGGSNSWVVHGSRTATGKPLLANDTHLGLSLPSIWYENGLYGGRYAVEGFSFPGAPFVAVGHNGKVAWGVTNMCADVQDLYFEKLDDPAKPTTYEYLGAAVPLEVRTEEIAVKGEPNVTLTIRSTRHGPIVNEALFGGKKVAPISLRWAAREGGTLFNALSALDRAPDSARLREALRSWDSPSLNFVYADVEGNIGYQATGRIPIRAEGHSGSQPAQGWLGQSEWRGFIPFDELPAEQNPRAGFIVSANNKVTGDAYPHFIAADWGDPFRSQRITELLTANAHVSMEDLRAIQADDFSLPAKSLLPFLRQVKPETELEKKALAQLDGWDLRFPPSTTAGTVYYLWYTNLLDEIIGDELGDELLTDFRSVAMTQTPMFIKMMERGESDWFDDVRTPERETRDQISARAFKKGVAWLEKNWGADPTAWRWGRLHTMTFVHQPLGASGLRPLELLFNSRTVESSGEPYSVNATFHDPGTSFAVASGPSQRFLADLSNLEHSRSSTPIGQSGLLFHPNREDQVDLWRRIDHHPMLFGHDAVLRAPGESLMLRPSAPDAVLTPTAERKTP